jgi:hypothetical protein
MSDEDTPLPLIEDAASGSRFLVYSTERVVKIELQVESDTFWATQQQMADAFGVTRQNITMHLQNIFKDGELSEASVCKETLRTARDGKPYHTKLYDLNALISVGYRVGGKNGTMFRIWATDKLFRYLVKGFVVDAERLKLPGEHDRVAELRDIIRDIRASEANTYAELRRICSMCKDYDPASEASREFYGRMQAKLYWAVTSNTPSMVLRERANASLPNMGLRAWPKDEIRQSDATNAKNFLGDEELRELNRLTTILLDIFDDQLDIGRLTLMSEASRLLDDQLRHLNRAVLSHGGIVSHTTAEDHARTEYRKFDQRRRALRAEAYQREVAALRDVDSGLPRTGNTGGRRTTRTRTTDK